MDHVCSPCCPTAPGSCSDPSPLCVDCKSGPFLGLPPTLLSVSFLPTADRVACRHPLCLTFAGAATRASAPSELTFLGRPRASLWACSVGTLPQPWGLVRRNAPTVRSASRRGSLAVNGDHVDLGRGPGCTHVGWGLPRTPRGLSLCSSGLYLSGTSRGYPRWTGRTKGTWICEIPAAAWLWQGYVEEHRRAEQAHSRTQTGAVTSSETKAWVASHLARHPGRRMSPSTGCWAPSLISWAGKRPGSLEGPHLRQLPDVLLKTVAHLASRGLESSLGLRLPAPSRHEGPVGQRLQAMVDDDHLQARG